VRVKTVFIVERYNQDNCGYYHFEFDSVWSTHELAEDYISKQYDSTDFEIMEAKLDE